MEENIIQKYSKHSLTILFLIIIAISSYILFSFVTAIISAAVIAYVFYPVFKKINAYIKNRGLCAFIMVMMVILLVVIPLFLIINAVIIEASNFYIVAKNFDITAISEAASKISGEYVHLSAYAKDLLNMIVSFLVKSASDFLISLPQKIVLLFITLFLMYYFFKDGERIVSFFEKTFNIHNDHKKQLLDEFNKVINATVYGILVSSVIQGLVGALGLFVFDVPSPIIWGSIMIFIAMIPFIGTWMIWVPAALFKLLNGEIFNGVGLLIYGAIIVSFIDNFLRPKLMSKKSELHPVLVILGVFGGLKAFGIMGLMIGPLLLGVLYIIYKFYMEKTR